MRHKRREAPDAQAARSPTVLDRLNPDVAGIDCGAAEHYVAVPPDRDPQPVQTFSTFTHELAPAGRLADGCRVKSVAMEATGVYWIPMYEMLEARGFEVLLVNARHLKNVPGRKSDVSRLPSGFATCTASGCCAAVFGRPPRSSRCAPISAIARR